MAESIYEDIQKLTPGQYVELYEMDLTNLGGDIYYFHGYTQVGPIYWQGMEYTPWPIKIEGMGMTGEGQQNSPTLSVGNVSGLLTALCRISEVFIPIAAGNYATNTSFSRSIGQGLMDSEPIPGTPFPARGNQQNHFDGAYGASGGIYFMAMEAPRTTMYWGTPVSYNRFFDIPTDRYPQALVISIDNLPFPFN